MAFDVSTPSMSGLDVLSQMGVEGMLSSNVAFPFTNIEFTFIRRAA